MGGISSQPGGPAGIQHSPPRNPRHPVAHRYIGGPHRHGFQSVLCLDGTPRRMGGRPLQPQVGNHPGHIVLERGHHVHRPGQRRGNAGADALHSHRRRRGLLRPGQLFASGSIPYGYTRTCHVHSPDLILCRCDSGRMARWTHSRQARLAVFLHHLRRSRSNMGHHYDTAPERLSAKGHGQ